MIVRPIQIVVNLTETHRRLIHAEIDLPVEPKTTVKLTTPLYLCESHVPNGPVSKIAGLVFTANGSPVPWRRDPFLPYVYEIDIPGDTHTLHASFDAILKGKESTRYNAVLLWDFVLLHQYQVPVYKMFAQACIILPGNWQHGSALQTAKVRIIGNNKSVWFDPVTVERLEDSPVLIGKYLSQQRITPDGGHLIHNAVSKAKLATVPDSIMGKLRNLVEQAYLVFGERPYRSYHFLVMGLQTKSSPLQGGEEHFESTRLVFDQRYLTDNSILEQIADTFCHEYTHAWNGKYRRPVGHVPDNFTDALDARLLWVYEGLTQYYGYVLAVRAGFISPETFRYFIANSAAQMDNDVGRRWRSTQDSAAGNSLGIGLGMYAAPLYWQSWLRDRSAHYFEGVLLWLDVDTFIRRSTDSRLCLDDFSHRFFSCKDGPRLRPVSYDLDEIVHILNGLVPHDWCSFFKTRMVDVAPKVNTRGIDSSGYQFCYSKTPYYLQATPAGKLDVVWYSIGVRLDEEGNIMDVRRFGPCDNAKLAPSQKIVKIGSDEFNVDAFMEKLAQMEGGKEPIVVTLQQDDDEDLWEAEILHSAGLMYPSLQRRPEAEDVLDAIMTAK